MKKLGAFFSRLAFQWSVSMPMQKAFNVVLGIMVILFVLLGWQVYRNTVPYDGDTGLPAYSGPCPAVINEAYRAMRNDRYMSQHLSRDNAENNRYFMQNVRGPLSAAFNYASFCEDKTAIGRLLYLTAMAQLDAGTDKAISIPQALDMAQQMQAELDGMGWLKDKPYERDLLKYRIIRVSHLAKYYQAKPLSP